MEVGARIHVPISVAETRISKRYDVIPSGTLYPNADEIAYLQRLVFYKVYVCLFDSSLQVLHLISTISGGKRLHSYCGYFFCFLSSFGGTMHQRLFVFPVSY